MAELKHVVTCNRCDDLILLERITNYYLERMKKLGKEPYGIERLFIRLDLTAVRDELNTYVKKFGLKNIEELHGYLKKELGEVR